MYVPENDSDEDIAGTDQQSIPKGKSPIKPDNGAGRSSEPRFESDYVIAMREEQAELEQFHEDAIFAIKNKNVDLLNLLLLPPSKEVFNPQNISTDDIKMMYLASERNGIIQAIGEYLNTRFDTVEIDIIILLAEMFVSDQGVEKSFRARLEELFPAEMNISGALSNLLQSENHKIKIENMNNKMKDAINRLKKLHADVELHVARLGSDSKDNEGTGKKRLVVIEQIMDDVKKNKKYPQRYVELLKQDPQKLREYLQKASKTVSTRLPDKKGHCLLYYSLESADFDLTVVNLLLDHGAVTTLMKPLDKKNAPAEFVALYKRIDLHALVMMRYFQKVGEIGFPGKYPDQNDLDLTGKNVLSFESSLKEFSSAGNALGEQMRAFTNDIVYSEEMELASTKYFNLLSGLSLMEDKFKENTSKAIEEIQLGLKLEKQKNDLRTMYKEHMASEKELHVLISSIRELEEAMIKQKTLEENERLKMDNKNYDDFDITEFGDDVDQMLKHYKEIRAHYSMTVKKVLAWGDFLSMKMENREKTAHSEYAVSLPSRPGDPAGPSTVVAFSDEAKHVVNEDADDKEKITDGMKRK